MIDLFRRTDILSFALVLHAPCHGEKPGEKDISDYI